MSSKWGKKLKQWEDGSLQPRMFAQVLQFCKNTCFNLLCTCVRFQMITLCCMFLRRWLAALVDLSKMLLWWRCLGIYECVYSFCISKRWTGRNSHLNPPLYSSGRTGAPLGSRAQANLHLELRKEKSAVLGAGMDRFCSLHCKFKQKWSYIFLEFFFLTDFHDRE